MTTTMTKTGDRKSRGRFLRYRKELWRRGYVVVMAENSDRTWTMTVSGGVKTKIYELRSRWCCNRVLKQLYESVIGNHKQIPLF